MTDLITDNYELTKKTDVVYEKLIKVKRNTKATKGGRVFGFSAVAVAGDMNGKFGIGRGRAKDASLAIKKAMAKARCNLIFIKLNNGTIYHKILVKCCATKVIMLPASEGTGIISPFVMRSIFEAVGIKNILTKCFGSKNTNNLVNCVVRGLLDMVRNVESNSIRRSLLKKDF